MAGEEYAPRPTRSLATEELPGGWRMKVYCMNVEGAPEPEHALGAWVRIPKLRISRAHVVCPGDPGLSRDDNWLGVPMFFGGVGETETRAALDYAGMTVLDWQVVPEDEGDGCIVRFLWLVAEKRE